MGVPQVLAGWVPAGVAHEMGPGAGAGHTRLVTSSACTTTTTPRRRLPQVLSNGQLVEQGAPQQLAAQPGGTFASMVTAARMAAAGSRPAAGSE